MTVNAAKIEKFTKTYVTMKAGTYPCRLVVVADLGMQAQRPFGNKIKPPAATLHTT